MENHLKQNFLKRLKMEDGNERFVPEKIRNKR